MGLTKRQRIKKKQEIIRNKKLCKEYPFLIPRNRWTDKIDKDYDYHFTELDAAPDGWRKLVLKLFADIKPYLIEANYLNKFRIMQLKEKYGNLRLYTGGIPSKVADQIYALINKTSRESESICIHCGKPAKMCCYQGWYSPYCEKCLKQTWNYTNKRYMEMFDRPAWKEEFDYNNFVCQESEE